MKKFLFTLILFLFIFNLKAQVSNLPKYYVVDKDTVGIILTVEQVQKLDNDVELLELFKKLQLDCENLTTHYVKIINGLEEKVVLMEVSIKDLNNKSKEQDDLINNLKKQVSNNEKDKALCDSISKNKDAEITILKGEVTKQNIKKGASIIGNVVLFITLIVLIVKM
jgi:peptidoglycan hydrolase CwlO-like protein